jgi:hypothetical protein
MWPKGLSTILSYEYPGVYLFPLVCCPAERLVIFITFLLVDKRLALAASVLAFEGLGAGLGRGGRASNCQPTL